MEYISYVCINLVENNSPEYHRFLEDNISYYYHIDHQRQKQHEPQTTKNDNTNKHEPQLTTVEVKKSCGTIPLENKKTLLFMIVHFSLFPRDMYIYI